MSTPIDPNPRGGDGPNKDEPGQNRAGGASEEHRQDEGRGEGGGAGHAGSDAPKTASKGINPVQHSE
ncbi:MAG: hypothetical protein ABW250_10900 [Pyrinomonadaceae bacterium]